MVSATVIALAASGGVLGLLAVLVLGFCLYSGSLDPLPLATMQKILVQSDASPLERADHDHRASGAATPASSHYYPSAFAVGETSPVRGACKRRPSSVWPEGLCVGCACMIMK